MPHGAGKKKKVHAIWTGSWGGKHIIRDGGVVARRTTQGGQNNTLFWFSSYFTIFNEHWLHYKEPYQTASESESLRGLFDFYMNGFRRSLNIFLNGVVLIWSLVLILSLVCLGSRLVQGLSCRGTW